MGVVSTYHDASLGLGVVALLVADHPRVDHLRAVSHHLMKEKKGLVCKIFDDFLVFTCLISPFSISSMRARLAREPRTLNKRSGVINRIK